MDRHEEHLAMTDTDATLTHSDADFVVPTLVGQVSIRRSGTRTIVSLEGTMVGSVGGATFREPWQELVVRRDGHSCLVVSRFGPVAGSGMDETRIHVFDDGLDIDDGRTVEEWRLSTPAPRDGFEYTVAPERIASFTSYRTGWLLILTVAVACALLAGLPVLAARVVLLFVGIAAMWQARRMIAERLRRQRDVSERLRVLMDTTLVMIGFGVALALVYYALAAAGRT